MIVTCQQGPCEWKWHFKVHFFNAQHYLRALSSYNSILSFKIKQGKKKSPGSSRDPQHVFTFGFYSSTFTKIGDFVIFSSVDAFPAALKCRTIGCSPPAAQLGTKWVSHHPLSHFRDAANPQPACHLFLIIQGNKAEGCQMVPNQNSPKKYSSTT